MLRLASINILNFILDSNVYQFQNPHSKFATPHSPLTIHHSLFFRAVLISFSKLVS